MTPSLDLAQSPLSSATCDKGSRMSQREETLVFVPCAVSDPDSESVYGSTDLIVSGPNPNPVPESGS